MGAHHLKSTSYKAKVYNDPHLPHRLKPRGGHKLCKELLQTRLRGGGGHVRAGEGGMMSLSSHENVYTACSALLCCFLLPVKQFEKCEADKNVVGRDRICDGMCFTKFCEKYIQSFSKINVFSDYCE